MFGFLPAPCATCHRAEHSAYRSYFCGLSSTLAREYGAAARFLTNRDGTFFSILSGSFSEDEPETSFTTCCNPLGKRRELFDRDPHSEFAAAVTVCGVHTKLTDDISDESGFARNRAKLGSFLLKKHVAKARSTLDSGGFPTAMVEAALARQEAIEREGASWEICSEPSATAFGAIFQHAGKQGGLGSELERCGNQLGKIIYLADAFEDRKEDAEAGRFNPLLKTSEPEAIGAFEGKFHDLQATFSKIEIPRNAALTKYILIEGLYDKCASIFGMAGSSSSKKRKKKSKEERSCWDYCDCCHCDCCCDCDCCPCDGV